MREMQGIDHGGGLTFARLWRLLFMTCAAWPLAMNYGKIAGCIFLRSSPVERRPMSSPQKPGRTDTRADRLMVRAIFLMLALLLHIQAIRYFSPRYAETAADAKAPLVVQLKPAPSVPVPTNPAPEPRQAETPLQPAPPSPAAAAKPSISAATPPPPAAAPEPFYHSPHALTRPPELVEEAPAEIELPESQEPGQLLLRLAIDRYGVVNGVSVLRSSLARELEGQVVLQFYRARYRPGEIDGVPVNSELLLVVNLQ
jgi:hypothetical protein